MNVDMSIGADHLTTGWTIQARRKLPRLHQYHVGIVVWTSNIHPLEQATNSPSLNYYLAL
jgi:hypothetical protein